MYWSVNTDNADDDNNDDNNFGGGDGGDVQSYVIK